MAHAMWTKLKEICEGDDNVRRAKVEILKGQFDQMKMKEDENIAKYVERIKTSGSSIKVSRGNIDDKTIESKVLRTLLPIYAIRVSDIREMRCDLNNKIFLDTVVGRLTAFELDNYDIYVPSSKGFESVVEAKLSLKKKSKGQSIRK